MYNAGLYMELGHLFHGRMKKQDIIPDAFKDSGTWIINSEQTYSLSNEILKIQRL